ncbi:MAG: hypothetical protein WC852_00470 [Candidatus Nanoarchaeia archaeon]|jgi:CRISPR/Cas system CMR-associated protein Cmr5 small subunit
MKYAWILIIAMGLLISGCVSTDVWDPYSSGHDFNSILIEKNISADDFAKEIDSAIKTAGSNSERAELIFLLARIKEDKGMMSFAYDFFQKAAEESEINEEKALLFETIASIEDTAYNHLRAAEALRRAKDNKMAMVEFKIAAGLKNAWKYDINGISNDIAFSRAFTGISLGNTKIELAKEDILVTQADGVKRDYKNLNLKSPYSEQILDSNRIVNGLKQVGLKQITASGTLAKEMDGKWYASNEQDVFMFEVPVSVIEQPTTRFIKSDIAIIADTKGMATIERQAMDNKATAVMAGCDSLGDVKAAKYLADKGVKIICSSDRMLSLLVGMKSGIVSSDFRIEGEKAVFGDRVLEISRYEPLVVMDYAGKQQDLAGYSTPAKYFGELEKRGAKMAYFIAEVDDAGQMDKVLKKAMEKKASVVAVRVYNEEDYNELKVWLEANTDRKAILFDSETSEFGYKIAREFRSQTFFGDVNPIVS